MKLTEIGLLPALIAALSSGCAALEPSPEAAPASDRQLRRVAGQPLAASQVTSAQGKSTGAVGAARAGAPCAGYPIGQSRRS